MNFDSNVSNYKIVALLETFPVMGHKKYIKINIK
jgi:hypothetical protein